MRFSPDGSLVAVWLNESGAPILIYETEGGERVQSLETHPCHNVVITFSPDNHWLAFEFEGTAGVLLYDLETAKRVANDSSNYRHFRNTSAEWKNVVGWPFQAVHL